MDPGSHVIGPQSAGSTHVFGGGGGDGGREQSLKVIFLQVQLADEDELLHLHPR